jgi:Beta-lactamase
MVCRCFLHCNRCRAVRLRWLRGSRGALATGQGSEGNQGCRVRPVHALVCETRFFVALALVIGLLGLAFGGEERLGSVQDMYDGTLPLDVEVNTFRHIDRVFPSAVVKHGGRVFPLLQAKRRLREVTFGAIGRQLRLADYIRLNRVAGVLVFTDGQIALERYELGNTPQTRWVSFSVVKSITSTLTAAAIHDGLIGGLDDPVARKTSSPVRLTAQSSYLRCLARDRSALSEPMKFLVNLRGPAIPYWRWWRGSTCHENASHVQSRKKHMSEYQSKLCAAKDGGFALVFSQPTHPAPRRM